MSHPSYFLADLPAEVELMPALITEACQTLKHNRERYFSGRSTEGLLPILESLGQSWLEPDYPFRVQTLAEGPAATGFSRETLAHGLDSFFKQLTAGNLENLLTQELGHERRLDEFHAAETDGARGRTALVHGPELLVHIAPGNLPNPALTSIVLGLLVRSAQFVKCASGQSFLLRMFAHSLYEVEPKLGACLEIAEWKGGAERLETALFAEADCVVASGSDESIAAIRARVPAKTRFLGYGTRVSFGYVAKEALSAHHAKSVARHAAEDVAAWNQLGCLSPHIIYVESGGPIGPELFAEMLATQLEEIEKSHPRGMLPAGDAAAIATRRSFYEVRAAHSLETKMWVSPESTAWTVVFEADALFQISCLNRFVYVKSVANLTEALQAAEPVRGKLSTVGLACAGPQILEVARQLAQWGVTRICPLGQMQNPPLAWRHDGRPALADLVTWCDWER